eukprot:sb/3462824/
MKTHKTAIIGGGVSGTVQAKCLLQLKVQTEIHIFEKDPHPGGVWDISRKVGGVMDCTVCNVSKYVMELTDFPWPKGTPDFPHHSAVLSYIRNYYKHFVKGKVQEHFQTLILSVSKETTGSGFIIKFQDLTTEEVSQMSVDRMIVANGHSNVPHFPTMSLPPTDLISHSATYKNSLPFSGKSVLVVGLSFSAVDVVVDLAGDGECESVSVVTRNGTWFVPKTKPNGTPSDVTLPRFFTHLPHPLQNWAIKATANLTYFSQRSWEVPNDNCQPAEGSMVASQPFVDLVRSGKVGIIHGSVENVTQNGDVVFTLADGTTSRSHFDRIIFCTGFSTNFEFLDEELRPSFDHGRPDLHLQMFKPDQDDLLFIGLFNVRYTSPFQVIDLQCQYAAKLANKTATIPPESLQSTHDSRTFRGSLFTSSDYRNTLAGLCGRLPTTFSLLRSPRLWAAYHVGPITWAGYNLDRQDGRESLEQVCQVARGRGWFDNVAAVVCTIMGQVVSTTDFEYKYDDEPHATRRKEILEKYPQMKELFGADPYMKYLVPLIVIFQLVTAYYIAQLPGPAMFFLAWALGGTINHNLSLAMHEISHNLAFGHGSPRMNRFIGFVANIPLGVPSSITFKKYHLEHHRYQGDEKMDVDIPTHLEGYLFYNTFTKVGR